MADDPPLDEFHHEGLSTVGLFQAVDGGDVGMVQRCEDFGFALEAGNPVGIAIQRGLLLWFEQKGVWKPRRKK